jgi:Na+-transporting methylmalonyl-CoA/oxaloacetate decarboxylase gamma subunit
MEKNILINEKGVALIIVLLMLLILTLIGISAISTTTFETNISGNERVGTDAFYASEAGIQIGLNQLPDVKPIPVTAIGTDSSCWSGSPQDKGSPQSLKSFGLYPKPGFDVSWSFKRFQVNTTGMSFKGTKELEVQSRFGPFGSGTQYNN